mgnify:FL=1
MAYVIAAPCIDVKDRGCVSVCPVDCIYEYDPVKDAMVVPDESMGSGQKEQVISRSSVALPLPADFDREAARRQLFIHPEECIDCGACESECPVEAIFAEEEVPEEWKEFTDLNAKIFGK